MNLRHEVQDIATELQMWASDNGEELPIFEALKIAAQVQQNRILAAAFVVVPNELVPTALESIAMELGAAKTGGTIKDAIYSIKET